MSKMLKIRPLNNLIAFPPPTEVTNWSDPDVRPSRAGMTDPFVGILTCDGACLLHTQAQEERFARLQFKLSTIKALEARCKLQTCSS